MQLDVREPAGEALGLVQQQERRRSQDQKAAGPLPAATAPIDDPAELLEELRRPMHLVEDDEAIVMRLEEGGRVVEAAPVVRQLQVEIERPLLARDLKGERRLPGLARAQQGHGGLPVESGAHLGKGAASDHPYIFINRIFDLQGYCSSRSANGLRRLKPAQFSQWGLQTVAATLGLSILARTFMPGGVCGRADDHVSAR